ncbi:MAG: hypothetical protein LBO71_09855 [Prevotellaceae bacterium]|jgi:hypothetical protein|nr:hypothetical protein [Prevotellaceae bacterium]
MSEVQNISKLVGTSLNVNAHLHTPYSFSAFDTLTDALDRAKKEDVSVVGINDFYSMDGYLDWNLECFLRRLYPLFNIEFISLQKEDMAAGVRVNDPNNPGRTYLSGKGLAYPIILTEPFAGELAEVREESNAHVEKMCGKLNELLASAGADFRLNFAAIKKELTKGSIRERHLAKALRMEAYKRYKGKEEVADFFEALFGGKKLQADADNHAAVENEIRGNLLKAGGAAFVPENPKAFLPLDNVCKIILAAGGIPTYPFLADDAKGGFTDFEQDVAKAAEVLKQRGIYSVEFITTRNSTEALERYATYLHEQGFVVTFGSEHNTPAMEPVKLSVRGGKPLSPALVEIGYAGACVVASHQQAVLNRRQGYLDARGNADIAHRDEYIKDGNEIIKKAVAPNKYMPPPKS